MDRFNGLRLLSSVRLITEKLEESPADINNLLLLLRIEFCKHLVLHQRQHYVCITEL